MLLHCALIAVLYQRARRPATASRYDKAK